jgi:hypothetical protein
LLTEDTPETATVRRVFKENASEHIYTYISMPLKKTEVLTGCHALPVPDQYALQE